MASRTNGRRSQRRGLRLETLEQRNLLAGVAIELVTVDAQGQPLSQVEVGDEFWLRGSAYDLNQTKESIFAAFVDVTYGADLVSANGEPRGTSGFVNGQSGDVRTAGQIDEVGGFRGVELSAVDKHNDFFFEMPFVAEAEGEVVFATNPAESIPAHDVLVYGSDLPVVAEQIDYGYVRLQVGDRLVNPPSRWRNPGNPFDVDNDGDVTPVDADLIEANLSESGARRLPAVNNETTPPPYLDVTGDGFIGWDDAHAVREQFPPVRPSPPERPNLPPTRDPFAMLREILPTLQQADVKLQVEFTNTRTNKIASSVRVGDILQVRATLTGLDEVFDSTSLDARATLMFLGTVATQMTYDPQMLTPVRPMVRSLDHSMLGEPPLRLRDGELFQSQFVAIQPGSTTLGTMFRNEDSLESGREAFRPWPTERQPLPPDFVNFLELVIPSIDRPETTLRISETVHRPQAADDAYSLGTDPSLVVEAEAGVLANDEIPTAALSRRSHVLVPPSHGRLQMASDGSFSYQPSLDFDGSDQFSYVVISDEATSNVAHVTLTGEVPPLAEMIVRAIDENGHSLETVLVGQEFFLQGMVEDLRVDATNEPRGVFSVDMQLSLDSQVAAIHGEVVLNSTYDAFSFGSSQIHGPDLIDIKGHSGLTATGLGEQEVFQVPLVATAAGPAHFSIDELRELRMMRFSTTVPAARVQLTAEPLTVMAHSRWQNPAEPADTNADAEITPLDALLGINSLTWRGAAPLADRDMTMDGSRVYLDTNGDGQHSPLDVMLTINQLPGSVPTAAASSSSNPLATILSELPQLAITESVVVSAAVDTTTVPASFANWNWDGRILEPENDSQHSRLQRVLKEIFAGEQ